MREGGAYGVALLLAGAMCLLPFLVPYHQLPVLSFYPEWLAAALGVCAALVGLVWPGRGARASAPIPALWLLSFAMFLLARATVQVYPQVGVLAALYVLFAAMMMWLGARLAGALGVERVALVLAGFLLGGALANALAGIIQFYGRPALLEDVVAGMRGGRAFGNIAQANLYANYLALGQSALLFLWLRLRIRTVYALAALLLLVAGSGLSASRAALVFAVWIALLGHLAGRLQPRLRVAAYCVAGSVILAHLVLPSLNAAFGPWGEGVFERMQAIGEQGGEPRWEIFAIALRVFASAPVLGVGVGGFAGAAFTSGLAPSLARSGEVLTSPHNLPLHLLAETGAVGTALALAGLCAWGWQAARRYLSSPQPALWWLMAAVGIELIHSLFEFPLWSADFLGVTAVLMGAGLASGASTRSLTRAGHYSAAGACAALLLALAVLLKDYVRLDSTRITGAAVTLANTADAQRDAIVLRELAHGPLTPLAELSIILGAPLDRSDLAAKLAMSGRVAGFWPSNAVVVRRAAFLALDGDARAALALLELALRTFPHLRPATIVTLEIASAADAEAMKPLLLAARSAP